MASIIPGLHASKKPQKPQQKRLSSPKTPKMLKTIEIQMYLSYVQSGKIKI
jgi:hypothetical protein